MKIKIKTKVVIKVLIIYWSCFFILWFLLKKLPEIREERVNTDLIQNTFVKKKIFYFDVQKI